MTITGSNGMNKTYSVELWAAVLEWYVQEELKKREDINVFKKKNCHAL